MHRPGKGHTVVFSFFRKKDQDDGKGPASITAPQTNPAPAPGKAGTGAPAAPAEPVTSAPDAQNGYDLSSLTIEVGVGSESLSAAEEQAVMLHANKQAEAAIAVLQAELPALKGKRRLESWLMLFELFQQTNQRAAFDALALDYVLEFEQSPPIWESGKPQVSSKPQGNSNYHAFGPRLTADTIMAETERLMEAMGRGPQLRADFSKVKEIDMLGAAELMVSWQQARKLKVTLLVLGSQTIIQLLSEKIEVGRRAPAEAPFWLLLIELYQALGLQDEFENLAVDYAVTYEVSPPSWDSRFAPRTASQVADDEARAKAELGVAHAVITDELQLSGDICAKQGDALENIRRYAQDHDEVVINLRGVARIDFESAGLMLNLFMGLQHKTLRIVQANEMVYGLLRLMGITDMVSVSRRKGG
ncbi:hypothetical protein [Chitinilyticum litopenaei]|uniref:hypothetical protein n=1 Tax=Chitinilyticum litopenaei TaxID=1121276 RepID=UPI001184AFDD|nr:hypothetical protein [Chitinilyticum litopenaei]